MHTLVRITFSLPPGVRGLLRLLLVAVFVYLFENKRSTLFYKCVPHQSSFSTHLCSFTFSIFAESALSVNTLSHQVLGHRGNVLPNSVSQLTNLV